MQFTKRQTEAIHYDKGNLQLIACAGSGKTEVVARHVARLLKQGAQPGNIIAFTFTDKAAAELKERITERCREDVGAVIGLADMFVGTIHAFCLELLKTEVPEFLKYGVLNEVQQLLFIDRHSKASGLTVTTTLDGSVLKRYTDTARYVSALNILREAQLDQKKLKGCSVVAGLGSYRQLLQDRCYLDYSAIMAEAVDALVKDKNLQQRLASRVKHVIVDEYQDLNPLQECIVRILHQLGACVCVVGDDDQTIYQWRGSDVRIILDFAKNYPNVKQLRLEENFRSSQGIVETARDFIKQNTDRLDKAMIPTDAQPSEAGDLMALHFDSPEEEAGYIAARIKDLRGVAFKDGGQERGLSYSDMAVLLRSVSNNADPIIQAFQASGIPFVVGGMNHLFDTPEVSAVRVLFYFMADRPGFDRAAVVTAWTDAALGLNPNMLKLAVEEAAEAKKALHDPNENRWNVYSIQRQYLNFLENIELREGGVPSDRGEVVFYNLGKFSQLISDFESIHYHSKPSEKYESFAAFLEYRAESSYPEGWQDNQYANPDAVRVMTVHQAKGMQWPVVFVPVLLKNRFPSAKIGGPSAWHIIPKDGVVGQARYEGTIEDERRLFYVAITRSQKFLFMTWAPIPGKNNRYTKTSEFWDSVLASKWVKRKPVSYAGRRRLPPQPRPGIANVVLSFSDVKYFFECPFQFKLRILYGFNAPIHEGLGYGKSLHDALAEVHQRAIQGDVPTDKDVPKLIGTHLHTPYAYKALREKLEQSATRILTEYLRANATLFDKIEFSEKKIEINLGDGVSVVGRIDLVRRLDTNETSIVDLKTSDRSQTEEVTETQLHVYALGYQELTGRRADYVEIYELDEGKRKPRAVDDDFIGDVKKNVKTAADSLRRGNLTPKASAQTCKNCDYQRMCTVGCKIAAGAAAVGLT